MKLKLYASRVAAAAGMHPFVTQSEVMEQMGLIKPTRQDPLEVLTASEKQQVLGDTDGASTLKQVLEKVCKPAVQAKTLEESTAAEKKILESFTDACAPRLGPEWTNALRQEIRKEINTKKGIAMETELTNRMERATGQKIIKRNNKTYVMDLYCDEDCVQIRGKIDGLQQDPLTGKSILVETKLRQKRLFATIPIYEKIQMEVYMRMLGIERAVLNQHLQYQDDECTLSKNWMEYKRDDGLWAKVIDGLHAFVHSVKEELKLRA